METEKVIGIGEILWDVFPDGKKTLGGAPANFAYHVSNFGFDSYTISAIGKDDLGKEILSVFHHKKLLTKGIEIIDYPTGTVHIQLDNAGIPVYDITSNVAWDYISFSPILHDLAKQAKAGCFGSLAQRTEVSRTTITQFLKAMPSNSYKIFDINLRGTFYTPEIIEKGLKQCNILKINKEELNWIIQTWKLPINEQDACSILLKQYDLCVLILTCGTDGSYVFSSNETSFLETPQVNVIDTVGAGDSFTAAFCAALLKGKDMFESHRFAVDVSAFVCSQQGAMPELPAELKNRLSI